MLPRPTRIVLVRPRNPNNIAACARAMGNFGVSELVVLDPFEEIWQETKAAPEAESIVLQARKASGWDDAVAGCPIVIGSSSFHQRPIEQATIELPNLNAHLASWPMSTPCALVFGSERSGLSNDELARCQATIHIPTQPDVPSMNLAQAVAVTLYELRRAGWDPVKPAATAPSDELEPFIQTIAAMGETLDYPPGYEGPARLGRIRQALQPAVIPPATVRFLLSFLRRLQKVLR